MRSETTRPVQRRIEIAERNLQGLELRKAGATFAVIARECGFKNSRRAYEAVSRCVRRLCRRSRPQKS